MSDDYDVKDACNNNTKQNKMVKFACRLLSILSALFMRKDWFLSFHLSKICFSFSILSRDSFLFIALWFLVSLFSLSQEVCFHRTFKFFGILNRFLCFGIISNTALFSLLFLSPKDGWKRKITRDRLAIADTEGIVTSHHHAEVARRLSSTHNLLQLLTITLLQAQEYTMGCCH